MSSNDEKGSAHAPRLSGGEQFAAWVVNMHVFLQKNAADGIHTTPMTNARWLALAKKAAQWSANDLEAAIDLIDLSEDSDRDEHADAAAAEAARKSSSSAKPRAKQDPDEGKEVGEAKKLAEAKKLVGTKVALSRKIHGYIWTALPDDLRDQVRGVVPDGFAYGLWHWLKNKFQNTEEDNVHDMLAQFFALQMLETETFDAWRARVNHLERLLAGANEKQTPRVYAFILLGRLTARFMPATLALKASGKMNDLAKINWDDIATFVNSYERSDQRARDGEATQSAMALQHSRGNTESRDSNREPSRFHSRSNRNDRSSRDSRDPRDFSEYKCRGCKQVGHIERYCPATASGAAAARSAAAASASAEHANALFHSNSPVSFDSSSASAEQPASASWSSFYCVRRERIDDKMDAKENKIESIEKSSALLQVVLGVAKIPSLPAVKKSDPLASYTAIESDDWLIDSGATDHIVGSAYSRETREIAPINLRTAGGVVSVSQLASAKVLVSRGRDTVQLSLGDALVVPDLPFNVLSVSAISESGARVLLSASKSAIILADGTELRLDRTDDNLIVLRHTIDSARRVREVNLETTVTTGAKVYMFRASTGGSFPPAQRVPAAAAAASSAAASSAAAPSAAASSAATDTEMVDSRGNNGVKLAFTGTSMPPVLTPDALRESFQVYSYVEHKIDKNMPAKCARIKASDACANLFPDDDEYIEEIDDDEEETDAEKKKRTHDYIDYRLNTNRRVREAVVDVLLQAQVGCNPYSLEQKEFEQCIALHRMPVNKINSNNAQVEVELLLRVQDTLKTAMKRRLEWLEQQKSNADANAEPVPKFRAARVNGTRNIHFDQPLPPPITENTLGNLLLQLPESLNRGESTWQSRLGMTGMKHNAMTHSWEGTQSILINREFVTLYMQISEGEGALANPRAEEEERQHMMAMCMEQAASSRAARKRGVLPPRVQPLRLLHSALHPLGGGEIEMTADQLQQAFHENTAAAPRPTAMLSVPRYGLRQAPAEWMQQQQQQQQSQAAMPLPMPMPMPVRESNLSVPQPVASRFPWQNQHATVPLSQQLQPRVQQQQLQQPQRRIFAALPAPETTDVEVIAPSPVVQLSRQERKEMEQGFISNSQMTRSEQPHWHRDDHDEVRRETWDAAPAGNKGEIVHSRHMPPDIPFRTGVPDPINPTGNCAIEALMRGHAANYRHERVSEYKQGYCKMRFCNCCAPPSGARVNDFVEETMCSCLAEEHGFCMACWNLFYKRQYLRRADKWNLKV